MIPKIIHYCWFGRSTLPLEFKQYIDGWKKLMPDYEIIEWNEDNFDVNVCKYSKDAYEAKKYAFTSDYCRLYALKNFGGIYFDTDVEVLKNFDDLLNYSCFIGFEDYNKIGTSVIAAEKESPIIKEFLDLYQSIDFIKENGKYNLTSNVELITSYLKSKGLVLNGKKCIYNNQLTIFPKVYFSPKVFDTKIIHCSEMTYSIHHFSQSWNSNLHFIIQRIKRILIFLIGLKQTRRLINVFKNE